MKTSKEIGNIGENIAEKHLKKKGYKILSRNYKARGGEIDIIAYRFGVLVYVEVKSRTNELYGTPAEAVDEKKVSNIKYAVRDFLTAYRKGNKIPVFYPFGLERAGRIRKQRLDVIEVYLDKGYTPIKINHIKDWARL